jgi:predicted DNA binding CopG/RHH family protein
MKLNADEKELLESVERGEWKSVGRRKGTRSRYARYAKATFRKDRRLNIRLSSKIWRRSEASARGGLALPDADLKPAAQVRIRPAPRCNAEVNGRQTLCRGVTSTAEPHSA